MLWNMPAPRFGVEAQTRSSIIVKSWRRLVLRGAEWLRAPRSQRNDLMRLRPGLEVAVLQMPQPGIDVAALEELLVGADVVHRAPFEHDDRIRGHQRGEAVRDDDQGAALGDAHQI